jgi:hypothetical protein
MLPGRKDMSQKCNIATCPWDFLRHVLLSLQFFATCLIFTCCYLILGTCWSKEKSIQWDETCGRSINSIPPREPKDSNWEEMSIIKLAVDPNVHKLFLNLVLLMETFKTDGTSEAIRCYVEQDLKIQEHGTEVHLLGTCFAARHCR